MSNWNKIFKPIVVLCVICIVMTGALAAAGDRMALRECVETDPALIGLDRL